jgi:hypothetical protein
MAKTIRIGCGAGYSGDRIDPAVALAESGDLDYLVFECLAERTIALAQKEKLKDPEKGYDPLLEDRFKAVLPYCAEKKTKIITNMGAANPSAASEKVRKIADDLGLHHLKVGMVLGDDVLALLSKNDFSDLREPEKILPISDKIISANAYLGSSQIIELLKNKADIIITGRTCDTSLFLAPMIHEFGWNENDVEKIGWGITASHLLECAGQVTGGYFADPGYKDVEGLANLGFPILEASDNNEGIITKLPDSGGEVSVRTCKEQLLYEVRDPASYKTADGFSDFTKIRFEQIEKNRVKISGGMGTKPPDIMKVIFGYKNGFFGEAQIAYGGSGAHRRAKLAAQILLERIKILRLEIDSLRLDFVGVGALWPKIITSSCLPKEVILRVAARSNSENDVKKLCNEVEALYTNGPAGGGGVRKFIEESIAVTSSYIPRKIVTCETRILGDENDQN